MVASNRWSMQVATDGKIYVAQGAPMLGVIASPNTSGIGCNYISGGQSIAPRTTLRSLPNFPASSFNLPQLPSAPYTYTAGNQYGCYGAGFTAPPAIQNFTQLGCGAILGYSLTGIQWNFGDPLSGAANTSTLTNPIHNFSNNGTYSVNLVLYYSCGGGTDTLKQLVNINLPCIAVSSQSITCSNLGQATVAAVGGLGPFSYTWMPSGQTGSVATGF